MARAAHAIQKAVRRARTCPECRGTGRIEISDGNGIDATAVCEACDGHGTATPRWALERIAHLEATVEAQRARIAELDEERAFITRHVGQLVVRISKLRTERDRLRRELVRERPGALVKLMRETDAHYLQTHPPAGGARP